MARDKLIYLTRLCRDAIAILVYVHSQFYVMLITLVYFVTVVFIGNECSHVLTV